MGVCGRTCPYVPTKGTGVHGVTSMDNYMVRTVVCGRTNAHYEYGRYEPIREISTYIVGKVRKGVSYDDALQKVSWGIMKLYP